MANGSRTFIGRFRIVNRTHDKSITRIKGETGDQVVVDQELIPPLAPQSALDSEEVSSTAPVSHVRVQVEAMTPQGLRVYAAEKAVDPAAVVVLAEAELLEVPVHWPAPEGRLVVWLSLNLWVSAPDRRSIAARTDGPPQWA